ncbi:hypothetical protein CVT24_004088 [Panaeolus cyanescens]|uniref:Uncharacterized protein n=1 Tax=Panaeolus cyanescens TaxID=181874 RepID=A0A409Y609_9AGAR|nr:hypothetical protein CVT24_004088 [Panaeolus cyanescens]
MSPQNVCQNFPYCHFETALILFFFHLVTSLGLHSAAATGNVGLVEYALEHGQPVNSVLDGVLPLHAACAGGNVQVVKVLIDHGADVNAPRLPRKYSNDRNRDTSAPIVGTSGSTPLHFAAANGNKDVITLLLLHGAHPDRADKHGVTPEALAQQSGWLECAQVLREWSINKDRDLRERERPEQRIDQAEASTSSPPPRRRLHVKQSIDTALNMLKSSDSHTRSFNPHQTPPASPMRPFGEYTFHPDDDLSHPPIDPGLRRPSLPHILQPPDSRYRKSPSAISTPDYGKQERPRSAGNGADRNDQPPDGEPIYPVYGRGGSARKLGSKLSLMSLFKKGQSAHSETSEGNVNYAETLSSSPGRSSAFHGSTVTLPTPIAQNNSGSTVDLNDNPPSSCPAMRSGFRFHRGSDASTRGGMTSQPSPPNTSFLQRRPSGILHSPKRANVPLAVDLHNALASQQRNGSRVEVQSINDDEDTRYKPPSPLARVSPNPPREHGRHRSSSSGIPPLVWDSNFTQPQDSINLSMSEIENGRPSPSQRPGILRAHNRTPSSGQGSSGNSRTLRFDHTTGSVNGGRSRDSPRSIPPPLKSFSSTGSLRKATVRGDASESPRPPPLSEDTISREAPIDGDGEDDDNYGQPLDTKEATSPSSGALLLQRQRGLSFASSSESSLSPILTHENLPQTAPINSSDFPFSISQPPAAATVEGELEPISSPRLLNVPHMDSRNRGDSLSSQSTNDSRNLVLMSGSTTSGSASSPSISTPALPNPILLSTDPDKHLSANYEDILLRPVDGKGWSPSSVNDRRSRSPLDIDIKSISSHAQAEALVERARQEVWDLAGTQDVVPVPNTGRTPLSARLAAYGESLALEKRLREQQAADEALIATQDLDTHITHNRSKAREGVERQLSLEDRTANPKPRRRPKDPRRPSTAEGGLSSSLTSPNHFNTAPSVSSSRPTGGFFDNNIQPPYQTPRSASVSTTPPLLSDDLRRKPSRTLVSKASANLDDIRTSDDNPFDVCNPDQSLSRISSLDGAETDSTPTVYRVATSPIAINRTKQEHKSVSAKKLTRMGYPVAGQASTRATPSTPPSSGSKGLGAIRSIMQSFKGKAS